MKNIPRFIPTFTFYELMHALFSRGSISQKHDALRVFAERFAKYIGVTYAIPAPSARVALAGLLHALKLPQGKEVILPTLTHHRVAMLFQEFGLSPRFVDIHPSTYCIDADKLEAAITPSTVCVVPVHLYGRACDMEAIGRIAERHGLVVIEDCAQACGGFYSGRRLGSFGQGAIFSFGLHKNLSMLGAGMVTSNSPELATKIKFWINRLSSIGKIALTRRISYATAMRLVTRPWFWNGATAPLLKFCAWMGIDPIEYLTSESPNGGSKTDSKKPMPGSFQGRIGLSQLGKLDEFNGQRIRNGNKLLECLQNTPGIEIPTRAAELENIYMSFVIRVRNPEAFRRRMLHLGVDTHPGNMFVGPHLPRLENTGSCEVAANAVRHMVHLPVYPQLREVDIKRIAEAVRLAVGE